MSAISACHSGAGVDQHGRFVAVEQRVGQIDAANAKIDELDAIGQRSLRPKPRHLDAESVIAVEDVADPGDEDRAHGGFPDSGSTSSRAK
jgi:hypothetical protein